jgi:hypothetical protein
VKLGVDTLSTVPDAPPWAGSDRTLDPPARAGGPDGADVVVAEEDAEQPAESPIAADISAAATIHPLFLFDSNRRTLGRRACLAMVTEADESGEDAGGGVGAAPVSWGLVVWL